VARLDEHGLVVRAAEGGEDAIDAVAGEREDVLDAPRAQPLQQVVGDLLFGHGISS